MRSNKYGFTLIELLAVIILLTIIALIATPIIIIVIDKAKEGATKNTVSGYIAAVENQVMINQVDTSKTPIEDGVYDVPMNEVTIKGKGPTSGWLAIEKGQVVNYSFVIGDYVATYGEIPEKGGTLEPKPINNGV